MSDGVCAIDGGNAVLLLDEADNVVIARRDLPSGAEFEIEGKTVVLKENIPTGFKLARTAIPKGEKILKYGAHIGSAIEDIEIGESVHIHNMKSDYLPTFTLDEGKTFSKGGLE